MRSRPRLAAETTCACGAVAVAVHGPVRAMLLCSCLACQKATGTGHSAAALIGAADFTIAGTVASFARPADSGATFTGHFCPACGTPLHGTTSRAPDVVLVPAGLFAGNSGWFVPTQLIFARSHADWDVLASELPRHAAYRPGGRDM